MAKIKSPLMSLDAKGSVGGLTFSKVRGINIAKAKSMPARRFRTTQPRNRSILSFLSMYFAELTANQRLAWQQWAQDHPEPDSFGGTFILTAHQAFIKLNFNAVRLDDWSAKSAEPPIDEPAASLDDLTVETGTVAEGDIQVDWSLQGTGDAGDYGEIQIAGPFMSPARQSIESRFRYIGSVAGNVVTYTAESLTVGMWYWLRVRYITAEGQATPWLLGQATPYEGP